MKTVRAPQWSHHKVASSTSLTNVPGSRATITKPQLKLKNRIPQCISLAKQIPAIVTSGIRSRALCNDVKDTRVCGNPIGSFWVDIPSNGINRSNVTCQSPVLSSLVGDRTDERFLVGGTVSNTADEFHVDFEIMSATSRVVRHASVTWLGQCFPYSCLQSRDQKESPTVKS